MPSFYPRNVAGQAPMTPPEFMPAYDCNRQYHYEAFYRQAAAGAHNDKGLGLSRGYVPTSAHSAHHASYQQSAYQPAQTLPPINSNFYKPIGAPVLPPLRIQDGFSADAEYNLRLHQDQQAQLAQQQAARVEEKPTGGVSATLDYGMERMTDFVSEAAQGIIQPGTPIQPSFRKWVSQVLCATRLPSATILLSLHYLSVRIREFPRSVSSSENQIYRLLAVSMILGSKFLDDNTFINRSWSDVSGINVSELNVLEIEWLALIGFDLHCDPADHNGVSTWLRSWEEYDAHATSKERARLTPLNTDAHQQAPRVSTHSPHQPQQYAKVVHGEYTPVSSRSSAYSGTPYLSADPWNRPDANAMKSFYNSQHRYPTLMELDYTNRMASLEQSRRDTPTYAQNPLPPMQSFTSDCYASPWNQSPWGCAHTTGCSCIMCPRQHASYTMAPAYTAQTVVG